MYNELIKVLKHIFKDTYYEDVPIRIGNINRGKGKSISVIYQGNNQEHKYLITDNMGHASNITLYFISDKELNRIDFYEELEKIHRKLITFNYEHEYEFEKVWVKFREGKRGITPVGINEFGQLEFLIDLNIYY